MIWNESVPVYHRFIVVASTIDSTETYLGYNITYVNWTAPANPLRQICTSVDGDLMTGSETEIELWKTAQPMMTNTCGDYSIGPVNTTTLDSYCENHTCTTALTYARLLWALIGLPDSTRISSATICTRDQPTLTCQSRSPEQFIIVTNTLLPRRLRTIYFYVEYANISMDQKGELESSEIYTNSHTVVSLIFNTTYAPTDVPTLLPTKGPSATDLNTLDERILYAIALNAVIIMGIITLIWMLYTSHKSSKATPPRNPSRRTRSKHARYR